MIIIINFIISFLDFSPLFFLMFHDKDNIINDIKFYPDENNFAETFPHLNNSEHSDQFQ